MHQKAYEQLALIDDEATRWARDHRPPAMNPPEPVARNPVGARWWVSGAAIAASLAAVISMPALFWPTSAPPLHYATTTEQKTVALPGGSSARLDRGTRLAIADGGRGPISIESGAAYFAVRHDPRHMLVVRAGDFVIHDIGTHFEVTRRDGQMSIAVEEGIVDVSRQGGAATRVTAGQSLEATEGTPDAIVRKVDPAAVASWRSGRLTYDNHPLSLVAADISRYTPDRIIVDPAVANLRLSGILLIEDGSHLVDQIEALLPVESRHEGHHIRLVRSPSRR
jgi:transmembrane sensor